MAHIYRHKSPLKNKIIYTSKTFGGSEITHQEPTRAPPLPNQSRPHLLTPTRPGAPPKVITRRCAMDCYHQPMPGGLAKAP